MTINANLKAQVQARINTAGNGSTLEELWNLKLIARGLDCNESNINNLIELRLNEFGASTELKSLLQGALSVRPYARNIVWKTQTFLTSGTFTRPAKMVGDTAWVTASAGGGAGAEHPEGIAVVGAWGGSWCKDRPVSIPIGSTHTVVIGAGGAQNGMSGGNTSFGSQILLRGGKGARTHSIHSGSVDSGLLTGTGIRPAIVLAHSTNEGIRIDVAHPAESPNGFTQAEFGNYVGSPACGFFGETLNNGAAPNNSGAGGGNSPLGFVGKSGGSGRLDIGWWEYE